MENSERTSEEKAAAVLQKLGEARVYWGKFRRGILDYSPQKGDVIVCTYAKSGTTLLQNMVYQLAVASGGASPRDPDGDGFKQLGEVTPWVEYSTLTGVTSFDSNPRVFKSHMPASEFDFDNKDIKYIYCYRDGLEIPGSLLDMLVSWMLPSMQMSDADRAAIFHRYVQESFLAADESLSGSGRSAFENSGVAVWFEHVYGWTSRKRENVLVLQFEVIIHDLLGTAKRIAKFLGLEVSEKGFEKVAERCGRRRMSEDYRFRETLVTKGLEWDPAGGVKARMPGEGGFRDERLSEEERKVYDRMLHSKFGVGTYEGLVAKIHEWQT